MDDYLFLAGRVELQMIGSYHEPPVYRLLTIVPHEWLNWLSLMPLSLGSQEHASLLFHRARHIQYMVWHSGSKSLMKFVCCLISSLGI